MLATLLLIVAAPLTQDIKPYVDPDGAFALEVPANWTASREDYGEGVVLTELYRECDPDGAHFDVIVQPLPKGLTAQQRKAIGVQLLEGVLQLVAEEATITGKKQSDVQLAGRAASRTDLDLRDEDGVRWKGWVVVCSGERNAFAIMPHAKAKDAKMLELLARSTASFAPEARQPLRAGAAGLEGSQLSEQSLTGLAARVKGGMRREAAGEVLAAGKPPLTYGSVADFVNVIELLFDVQLTEAEFAATRARFVEYYGKSDDEGKRVLAEQGATLLKSLTTGTAEQIARSREEGHAVFENAFRRGAELGIGYAEVMWQAIQRRTKKLAASKAAPAKAGFDNEITEGDVDATMELLYFMWVAAGRDPAEATLEDIARIRAELVRSLPTLAPEAAVLVANAPKVYAGMRQQWAAASAEQRVQLAVQYGRALDEWGLGAGSGFEQQSGGGGGGGEYSLNAQIAQNTAWNAAKTW